MSDVTILDFPLIGALQTDDVIYVIRGAGANRDKRALAQTVVPTVLDVTSTSPVDLSTYEGDLVIMASGTITITLNNSLPNGRKLTVINEGANDVTLAGLVTLTLATGQAVLINAGDGAAGHIVGPTATPYAQQILDAPDVQSVRSFLPGRVVNTVQDLPRVEADWPGDYDAWLVLNFPYARGTSAVNVPRLMFSRKLVLARDTLYVWVPDVALGLGDLYLDAGTAPVALLRSHWGGNGLSWLTNAVNWKPSGQAPTGGHLDIIKDNNIIIDGSPAAGALSMIDAAMTVTTSQGITINTGWAFRIATGDNTITALMTMRLEPSTANIDGAIAGNLDVNALTVEPNGYVWLVSDVRIASRSGNTTAIVSVLGGSTLNLNGFRLIIDGADDAVNYPAISVAATGAFVNSVAGGLLLVRGRHDITDSAGGNWGDVELDDLGGNTYVRQQTNITVEDLTIGTGCTWDRNGNTLTINGTLTNNGSLIN